MCNKILIFNGEGVYMLVYAVINIVQAGQLQKIFVFGVCLRNGNNIGKDNQDRQFHVD